MSAAQIHALIAVLYLCGAIWLLIEGATAPLGEETDSGFHIVPSAGDE